MPINDPFNNTFNRTFDDYGSSFLIRFDFDLMLSNFFSPFGGADGDEEPIDEIIVNGQRIKHEDPVIYYV